MIATENSHPAVSFQGGRMHLHFERFGLAEYRVFLEAKRIPEYSIDFDRERETYTLSAPERFAGMLGLDPPAREAGDLPLSDFLFDDQTAITRMALALKRFAYWGDCGLGKTLVGLEWARQVVHRTGRRVLIFTFNEIVPQWLEEAKRFYGDSLPVVRLKTREEMIRWAGGTNAGDGAHNEPGSPDGLPDVAVTNYEKLNHRTDAEQVINELRQLGGIAADESHRLRTGGGRQKWALIKSSRGVEYKLSLTATPAPNDTEEFASQASFLERLRAGNDILWTYFVKDKKTHRWTVKRHARQDFFRFMASWSIYVRDPRRYGWRQGHKDIPPPVIEQYRLPMTAPQVDAMQRFACEPNGQMRLIQNEQMNAIQRMKLSQIAKGFAYRTSGKKRSVERISSDKPPFVADLTAREAHAGLQCLVWTVFDEETVILAEHLSMRHPDVAFEVLTGKTKPDERLAMLERFRTGQSRVLISNAKLLGHGMNFQFCRSMIFSGWDDSYVAWYQAIRRAVRYGQTERVRVHVPFIPDLEGDQLENILGKEARNLAEIEQMEQLYVAAVRELGLAA